MTEIKENIYINKLKELNKQDIIEIYDNLVEWEWDNRLGEIPTDWDSMLNYTVSKLYNIPTKCDIVHPIIKEIEKMVSEKQLRKYQK